MRKVSKRQNVKFNDFSPKITKIKIKKKKKGKFVS